MGEITSGLPGVSFTVGDHVCSFYRGDEERDSVLFPYLSVGLVAGDRCVCVLDRSQPEDVAAKLTGDNAEGAEHLTLFRSEDSYLAGGSFSPDEMMAFWTNAAHEAFDENDYQFLRAAGEMTWALNDHPGVNLLVNYESELNRFTAKFPQTVLCLYDLDLFTDGELLIDILRTHPKVLMSGTIVENPWYTDPDEFLALNQ